MYMVNVIAVLRGKLLVIFLTVFVHQWAYTQTKLECNCSEIGIDPNWADTNAISCYKIPVNQIYTDSSKGKKSIAVIRAFSKPGSNQLPLLYLHGGPGISTLDNAQRYLNDNNWKLLRNKHDIIMMDYSGTGYSEPFLCHEILDSISIIRRSSLSSAEKKEKEIQLTMNCRESLEQRNIDINTFSSVQMAADATAVRVALGIDKWQIYGVSYGTLVALMSIRHFPENIKSVVLDSPLPPNAASFDFVNTMNETLQQLQSNVSDRPELANHFPDIIADFTKTAERLNKQPIKISGNDFTGDDFAWAMVMTFYKTKTVRLLPLALKEFASGNDSLLTKWISSLHSENQYGKRNDFQNKAITCYECKPRYYHQTALALERRYPHLKSLSGKEFMDMCQIFRPEKPDDTFYEPVESDIPALVLSGEFDPGTPPSFALSTVKKLKNATLVIVPNASHSAMHYNECTLNLVDKFLEDSELPLDTNCINQIENIEFATSNLYGELDKMSLKTK